MAERVGALAGIGNTPVVKLSSYPGSGAGDVWVKLEAANPTGSYKDRMALAMIEGAEARGDLQPGQTVVEYTGGSTGSSLAFVCSLKGYPLKIVTSNVFAEEKLQTMRAFGAELEIIHSDDGIHPRLIPEMQERAAEIVTAEARFRPISSTTSTRSTATSTSATSWSDRSTVRSTGWRCTSVSEVPTREPADRSAGVGPGRSERWSSPPSRR